MDIHKPKAAHSLREFAVEIGTIICGILIALSLEQAVEAVRHGGEVREAREALRVEIGQNMHWLEEETRYDACSLRYLGAYTAWAHGGPRPETMPRNYPTMLSSVWDVSRGAVALMPLEERAAFSRFYGLAANYNSLEEHQRNAARRIGELYGLDSLSMEDRAALLKAARAFGQETVQVKDQAEGLLEIGRDAGAKAAPMSPELQAQIAKACHMADHIPAKTESP